MKEKIFDILSNIIIVTSVYLFLLVSCLFFGMKATKRFCIQVLEEFPGLKSEELNMLSEVGIPVLSNLEGK